jgi:hypothetical protein
VTTALFVLNIDIGGMSAAASSGSHLRAVETTFHTGADPRRHPRFNHRLAHDLGKGIPFFPRDRREAFARRSCSIQKIARDDDLIIPLVGSKNEYLSACAVASSARQFALFIRCQTLALFTCQLALS